MMDATRELAVLLWVVAAGLVATVAMIVALIWSGRSVPPFATTAPHDPPPQPERTQRPKKRKWPLIATRTGRS